MKDNKHYVYVYYDENEVAIYVGKGKNNRAWDHLKLSNSNISKHVHEMKLRDVKPDIQIVEGGLTMDESYAREAAWIAKYGRTCDGSGTLLNISTGSIRRDIPAPTKIPKSSQKYLSGELHKILKEKRFAERRKAGKIEESWRKSQETRRKNIEEKLNQI